MDKEAEPDLSTIVLFSPDTKISTTASSDEFTTLYPGATGVATPIDKGVMVELVAVLPVVPDEVVPVGAPPPPPPQAVKSKDVAMIAVIVIIFFIVLFPFDY